MARKRISQTDERTAALVKRDDATAQYRAEKARAESQGKPTLRDTLRAARGTTATRTAQTVDASTIPTHKPDGTPYTAAQRLRMAQGKTVRDKSTLAPEEAARRDDMKLARRVKRAYEANKAIAENAAMPEDVRNAARAKMNAQQNAYDAACAFHGANLKRK